MDRRLELHFILQSILGLMNVYFQPPSTINMNYPCIIYSLKDMDMKYADDKSYHTRKCYEVTVVDRNPDSIIPDKIAKLGLVSFDRHYVADNLNHSVFTLYF